MVIDADALNIIADDRTLMDMLGGETVLSPHPGEFRRLTGSDEKAFGRLLLQQEFSKKHSCVIVLKGAHTSVSLPDGRVWFNSTGNPGMATAGSGDSLTGIILGLVAQHIPPEHAAIAGVFLHGLAGDIAAHEKSENALIAGDITDYLGKAFFKLC
jgi:NAD(P)H-hydrate epimerase